MKWFDELLHSRWDGLGYTQRFKVKKVVYQHRSEHQNLLIFETPRFGRVLALDGVIQTTEKDEFTYHEMLSHVPIIAHGQVKNVLIIGGGDGGALREVLRHEEVECVTIVEIDKNVVELCKKYLPQISDGAFENPRTNLVFGEGSSFVATTKDTYDLIIIDSTDPIGPGEALFTEEFYKACYSRLSGEGILVNQSGVPFVQETELCNAYRRLSNVFEDATFYLTVVPTYVGGYMALGWASDLKAHRSIALDVLEARYKAIGLSTRYYSPKIHMASFDLPPFITEMMTKELASSLTTEAF